MRSVGKHVREEAATVLQKWARGASVRLGWDMPGLCDSDGELVVYGQPGRAVAFYVANFVPWDGEEPRPLTEGTMREWIDGWELVVYGQPGGRLSFPILHSVNAYQARSRQIWLALDEMEEVD